MTANERRPGKTEAARMSLAGDETTVTPTTDTAADPHCCLALSIEQRLALGRRGLFCSEARCARAFLIGEAS